MAQQTNIKWNRSEGGYTVSKCGSFRVEPIYIGRTTIQAYRLFAWGASAGMFDTQREAKARAAQMAGKRS